jgi:parvulin-like peptidyl-prolyl isomerase
MKEPQKVGSMKNKNIGGTCLAIILAASGTVAQQPATPPKPAEGGAPLAAATGTTATPPAAASSAKVVLKVGATQITESEVDFLVTRLGSRAKAIVANEGLRPVAEEYVQMLLLSRQALDEHLDSSPALRRELEFVRDQMLAQAEYQKMTSAVKVSQEEISQYFNAHQSEFETVQIREFLIRKRPQDAQDPKQGLTAEEAKTKAEAIRKALLAGTDIERVAEDFATTPTNAVMLIDRKPRAFRRGQMVPALEKATFDLKDGEVSESVDTPQAFIVVKVFGHQHPELKEVAAEIETKLRQQKLNAEVDDLRNKAGVWMDEDYFKAKPAAPSGSAAQPPASARTPKP